jgi:hypothetical protein
MRIRILLKHRDERIKIALVQLGSKSRVKQGNTGSFLLGGEGRGGGVYAGDDLRPKLSCK